MSRKKKPRWLLTEAILALHKMLIAEHGGTAEVRDRGLLESALARPENLFGYEHPIPSFPRLAACHAFGIAKNHPFVDGNKRVALTASAVFLEINGYTLEAPEAEAAVVFEGVAAGKISEEELAAWFDSNTKRG